MSICFSTSIRGEADCREESPDYDTVIFQSQAFFAAKTASNGFEPWTTDGTVEGTKLLADMGPVSEASPTDLSRGSNPHSFTLCRDKLYFVATSALNSTGETLYSMSSPTEKPQQVALKNDTGIRKMACVGRTLYVVTHDKSGQETLSVLNKAENAFDAINPLKARSEYNIQLYPTAERMYFYLFTEEYEFGLWVSDGTKENTWQVFDFDQVEGVTQNYLDGFVPYEWQL